MILLILLLSVTLFINSSIALNDKVIVTALYYVDLGGRIILVTGTVPKSVEKIIKADLQDRIKKDVSILVVPLFEKESEVPKKKNILQLIKDRYRSIYVTGIPILKSMAILGEMKQLVKKTFKRNLSSTSATTDKNYRRSNKDFTAQVSSPMSTPLATPMKDLIVHDVYYGICPKGANGCQLDSPPFSELLSTQKNPLHHYVGATPLILESREFFPFSPYDNNYL